MAHFLTPAFMILANLFFTASDASASDHCADHGSLHNDRYTHSDKRCDEAKASKKDLSAGILYGSALHTKTEKVALTKLIGQQSLYFHKIVQIQGKVENIYSAPGYWLNLISADREIRIEFKDDKLVIPMSLRNQTILVEGELVEKSIDVPIPGSTDIRQKKLIYFVATGLEIIIENNP